MNFSAIGCSFRTAPVAVRERLAFTPATLQRALAELTARYSCEAVVLGTCNRVELYLARPLDVAPLDAELVGEYLCELHHIPHADLRPHLYAHYNAEAIRHLFRVVASLDSLVVGEGQIAGQVKEAYESARAQSASGPFLNALFQQARQVAKRVRSETGISRGNVSISSVAVEFVRGVFSTFADKTVLVIGAGKMGGLTLHALRDLAPRQILVINRTLAKAQTLAHDCGGTAVPWEKLDDALAQADIVLSTTGAPTPIITKARYEQLPHRPAGPVVMIDIAIPRDIEPSLHDSDRVFLYNVDDLHAVRDRVLAERRKHIAPAEQIVEQEQRRFLNEWSRRRNGPIIARLQRDADAKRQAILTELHAKLTGPLTEADRKAIDYAFRLFQNQLLHGPISTLNESSHESGGGMLDALRRLFRLGE
jgi:glutamyl-tRNA reductase